MRKLGVVWNRAASEVERQLPRQLIAKLAPVKLCEHFSPYPVNKAIFKGLARKTPKIQPGCHGQSELCAEHSLLYGAQRLVEQFALNPAPLPQGIAMIG